MADRDSDDYASPEEEEVGENASPVADFFRGRNIFITGVTGFLGKVLLEKLLRSCSKLNTVYVLLRAKDGESARQRLDILLSCQIFGRVRQERPALLGRVVPIEGDISLPGLGLSQADANMLTKQVSVVFHSAATVRFDEPLKKSVQLNLLGTKRVLDLSKRMTKLAAFVHVSTAYSYCNRKEIDEVIYPETVSPQKVIDMTEWMDDELLEFLLPKLLSGRPTTYHYSKALAESLLQSEGQGMPIAIVRPSIVTAAFKEPLPGWVDGLNGPTTFIIMTGRGLLRTMLVYEGSVVDWMPVDLVANLLITSAWHVANNRTNISGPEVFNCTSGDLNRVTWDDVQRTAYPLIMRYPSLGVLRYPGGSFKSSLFLNTLSLRIEHALPACIVDTLAPLIGQRTQFTSMVRRMERAAGYLEYFTTKEWKFRCTNLVKLRESQTQVDRQEFNFDVRPIEWTPYLETYVRGVRKFILNEDDSTLPAARRRIRGLYWTETLAKFGLVVGTVYLLLTKTRLSNHLLWALISISFRIMQHIPPSWFRYLPV